MTFDDEPTEPLIRPRYELTHAVLELFAARDRPTLTPEVRIAAVIRASGRVSAIDSARHEKGIPSCGYPS